MPRSLFFAQYSNECSISSLVILHNRVSSIFVQIDHEETPERSGWRVRRIPRPAPASAVRGGTRPERCRTSVGWPSPLRLSTEAPGPSPRKSRPKRAAFLMQFDILGTVDRTARSGPSRVAFDHAIFDPGKGTCRGGPAWSTRADGITTFLAEITPERRR